MGTVLSISPSSKKASIMDVESGDANKTNDKSLKKHSMFVSLSWKKLVANPAKKSAKKVTPNPVTVPSSQVAHLNNENARKSHQTEEKKPKAPIPVQCPRLGCVQKQPSTLSLLSPRRIVIQASTGELLRCLADFICRRCYKLKELNTGEVIMWFRNIDRTLLLQGWQDQGFITPANVVFVYLLCEDAIEDSVDSPVPFMSEANKEVFWETSLRIINRMSAKMLQLNADPHFFTQVFQELKNQQERQEEEELSAVLTCAVAINSDFSTQR
ncbi:hypothetical protein WMY93_030597 [Mugilogobius chulae]|uniref:Uncharacterized protein n=1 Tax=Mugilogobius chulae TaxID=88201 RepID=A0AAW0ML01_9GOBI